MNSAAVSLADVSKILGHSKWSITNDFYKHLSVEAQAVSMDKLGQVLLGNALQLTGNGAQ